MIRVPGRVSLIACAALALLAGLWAGSHFKPERTLRLAPPRQVQTPAGEASAPSFSDLEPAGLAAPATTGLAAQIPQRMPRFSLADRTGKTTSIGAWDGKSLIVNFWATWCAPCRREMPLLKALSQEWSDRQVMVVGIAVDHRDKVNAYAAELKIPYPLLVGEQDALDVAADLGMTSPAFPFTVFTDRSGEIVTLYVGELHRAQADLILAAVQSVNEHRTDLEAARERIAAGLQALARPRPG